MSNICEGCTKCIGTGTIRNGGIIRVCPDCIERAKKSNALDTQQGGDHYRTMKIQPIEFITANSLDFLQGNVIKYITRHKAKNGAEDIRKAIHYCELILQLQYGEGKQCG